MNLEIVNAFVTFPISDQIPKREQSPKNAFQFSALAVPPCMPEAQAGGGLSLTWVALWAVSPHPCTSHLALHAFLWYVWLDFTYSSETAGGCVHTREQTGRLGKNLSHCIHPQMGAVFCKVALSFASDFLPHCLISTGLCFCETGQEESFTHPCIRLGLNVPWKYRCHHLTWDFCGSGREIWNVGSPLETELRKDI